MKKILYLLILLFFINLQGQENNNGILLGAFIPKQATEIPSEAKSLLIDKLGRIITKNGLSANVNAPRFILVPKVSVLSKNTLATAPPKVALYLEVTFYIGDGIAGNLFESKTIKAKGVGTNERKAYISAIRNISDSNKYLIELITKGKEEIISYYDSQCADITKKASRLEDEGKIGEALFTITNIPESSTCFDSNKSKIKKLYDKAIDEDCARKLNLANAIWTANQDLNAANKAGAILASVEPTSNCFEEVKALYDNISERVKSVSDRDWEYQLKELEIEANSVEAARDIGVAYGQNQAQNVTYNTRGWYD
ncbi:MAG: hypothetical protein NWQ38_15280 [Cellulophaga sp.]|nr:hypothetical protein [Cellulophaga sp.]